jgi:two-component system, chemotaxis family, protein-glutamate methylesterase/glutaminase
MSKIRVLIVDDSVVVRSRVTKLLNLDPEIEVIGIAAHGRIALAKIPVINPDVVILDVEMPEMNGLETLVAIRQNYPRLPVIMFSTFTVAGATTTLEALALGATDYATKPSNLGSVEAANEHICNNLIPKIKQFGATTKLQLAAVASSIPLRLPKSSRNQKVEVLAIGVSTGGPNALAVLLSEFPADFSVPIVIVQHMPSMFTQLLAQRLATKSRIRVTEAFAGGMIEPGQAWIAPGDFHMIVEQVGRSYQIGLHQEALQNSCRPSVDVLFRSVTEVYGAGTLAIVLTGMGQDGLRGCQSVREVGGQILVQDEASSVVWGMPGFVAKAGLADQILPLDEMAFEIIRRVQQ